MDRSAGELRKNGAKVRLQEQPLLILAMLLERPGEVVSREDLRQKLWPAETFVDFDNGLNGAMNKLRATLGDTADNPRFVETLPRRGYRFIAPVEGMCPTGSRLRNRWQQSSIRVPAVIALVAVLVGLNVAGLWECLTDGRIPVEIRSLAVLPLENLSGDPAQEYLADGMTDALIGHLGKIEALHIISRTSSARYKGTDKSLPEIARELNVDVALEGTVLLSGDRVRITAQLIEAATDRPLWTQSYERDLRDVLALQRDVARAIAQDVELVLTRYEESRPSGSPSAPFEARASQLKGGSSQME